MVMYVRTCLYMYVSVSVQVQLLYFVSALEGDTETGLRPDRRRVMIHHDNNIITRYPYMYYSTYVVRSFPSGLTRGPAGCGRKKSPQSD